MATKELEEEEEESVRGHSLPPAAPRLLEQLLSLLNATFTGEEK